MEMMPDVSNGRMGTYCNAKAKPTKRPASSSTLSETTSRSLPLFLVCFDEPGISRSDLAGDDDATLIDAETSTRLGGSDSDELSVSGMIGEIDIYHIISAEGRLEGK